MKRRAFIAGTASAVALPFAARAQQGMPVIGFLGSASPDQFKHQLQSLRQGLKDAGYVEGENFTIEYRWANDRYDRLPAMAADLVRRNVAAIVTHGPAVLPAKAATKTIPIVFFTGVDPVEAGIVSSLNRPGGNLTGVSMLNVELSPKRLELARELAPAATELAVLINPANPNASQVAKTLRSTAEALRLQLHILHANTEHDIGRAFETSANLRASALVIGPDPYFNARIDQFAALTLRHRLPTIYQYREFVAAGGLMAYGGSITDLYGRLGSYAGRVLKGEKPADLPVQQSTKAELIVNLKVAKTIGINLPQTLLARADEVIE